MPPAWAHPGYAHGVRAHAGARPPVRVLWARGEGGAGVGGGQGGAHGMVVVHIVLHDDGAARDASDSAGGCVGRAHAAYTNGTRGLERSAELRGIHEDEKIHTDRNAIIYNP